MQVFRISKIILDWTIRDLGRESEREREHKMGIE